MRQQNLSQIFQSFHGVLEVVFPLDLTKELKNKFEMAKAIGYKKANDFLPYGDKNKYGKIKLIDTFFSDTIPQDLLIDIFQSAKTQE